MGKIPVNSSLEHAQLILQRVQEQPLPEDMSRFNLQCWSNGREQGFSLQSFHGLISRQRRLNWAEHRNSDQIVLHDGLDLDFDISTHQPSEALWRRGMEVSDDEAVMAIVAWINREWAAHEPYRV